MTDRRTERQTELQWLRCATAVSAFKRKNYTLALLLADMSEY